MVKSVTNFLKFSCYSRCYSSKTPPPINYIPFGFTIEEANKKFVEAKDKQIFAPIEFKTSLLPKIVTEPNPLTKIYLCLYGVNCEIASNTYEGESGEDKTRTVFYTDSKGHLKTKEESYIKWRPFSGVVLEKGYNPNHLDMCIYAGERYDKYVIEEAFNGIYTTNKLKDYDPSNLDKDTVVDSFKQPKARAYETAYKRVKNYEEQRVIEDIKAKSGYQHGRVSKMSIKYKSFKLNDYLYPAYILQYVKSPPQILPAIHFDTRIIGPNQLSVTKVTILAGVVLTVLSRFLPPHIILAHRIGMVIGSSLGIGAYIKKRLAIINYWQEQRIEKEKKANASVAESLEDKNRRILTGGEDRQEDHPLNDKGLYYKILELDPREELTEEHIDTV